MNGVERLRMMWAALALAAAACGDESAIESAPTPEDPESEASSASAEQGVASDPSAKPVPIAKPQLPPSGHAVVRVGALLFDSSTGEVGFEVPPMGTGATASVGLTVNVVARKDGRLEVETLVAKPAEHHCAGSLVGLTDFRLRLFVAEDDLLPVVTEEVTQQFEDGTKVRVARGVPVPGKGSIVAAGTPVEIRVPSESLGPFSKPSEPFSKDQGEEMRLDRIVDPMRYDGERVLAGGALYQRAGTPRIFDVTKRESDTLVTVRNACLEVVARTDRLEGEAYATKDAIPQMARNFDPDMMARNAGILGMLEQDSGHFLASPYGEAFRTGAAGEPVYSVKAGVAVLWSDGEPAGLVTSEHTFTAAPRDEAGKSCFDVPLTREPAPSVTLCFAPGDVTQTESSGGLGLSGIGGIGEVGGSGGGAGLGGGAGFGGRGKTVPRVRQAKAAVKGSLDKDIIRRIVRAHINEVRYCYNQGLARDPVLEGRVAVQFTINPKGKVSSSVVSSSTLTDKNVGNCVAKAIKRWKFPKPTGGGNVVVTYPFVLAPG